MAGCEATSRDIQQLLHNQHQTRSTTVGWGLPGKKAGNNYTLCRSGLLEEIPATVPGLWARSVYTHRNQSLPALARLTYSS